MSIASISAMVHLFNGSHLSNHTTFRQLRSSWKWAQGDKKRCVIERRQRIPAIFEHIHTVFFDIADLWHEYNFVFIMALHDPEHIVVSREDHLQFDWKSVDELKSIRFLPTAMIELLEKAQEGTSSYFDSSLEVN